MLGFAMKPVHTGSRPVAKNGNDGITGPVENPVQPPCFFGAEGPQYVIDNITPAGRTPDADAQPRECTTAQGIHN